MVGLWVYDLWNVGSNPIRGVMTNTLYGDAFISLKLDSVDCGEPQLLHDIFDLAIENGARPLGNPHPLNVHQRVLNGLERDDRFMKGYISYPGIYAQPVRHFQLKWWFVDISKSK